jgi:hypothetical protein
MQHRRDALVIGLLTLVVALSVLANPASAQRIKLPEQVPVPEVHAPPEPGRKQSESSPQNAGEIPVPEERPDEAAAAPETPPLPTQAPDRKQDKPDAPAPGSKAAEPRMEADPRSGKLAQSSMPSDETACRVRLKSLGVTFENQPAESGEAGCALPYPVSVGTLGPSIALEPDALMNCAMAETMARFTSSVIATSAKAEYGSDLHAISHASAYVCRPRNGTMKLSEHAFGNALDIARLTLADKTAIDVKPDPDAKAARVLGAIRKAACGPFKTVLGPGSDADHALHLHFDLAPRRNGGTFCQ